MNEITFTRLLTDGGLRRWDLKGPAGLIRFEIAGIRHPAVDLHATTAPGGTDDLEPCDVCGRCWHDTMATDAAQALYEDWKTAAYHDAVIRTQLERWYAENLAAWAAEQAPEDQVDDRPTPAVDPVAAIVDLVGQYGTRRGALVNAGRDGRTEHVRIHSARANDLLDRIRRALAAADQAVPAKDLPMLLAKHAPGLPYVALARLAAALDQAGYRVVSKATTEAGAPC